MLQMRPTPRTMACSRFGYKLGGPFFVSAFTAASLAPLAVLHQSTLAGTIALGALFWVGLQGLGFPGF